MLVIACVASCYTQGDTTCGQENEPLVTLRGKVVKGMTDAPVEAGTHVAVELCGHYSVNPDPSKAHPNYRYATATAADGTFEIRVPRGPGGLHTYFDGYRYGTMPLGSTDSVDNVVRMEPLLASDVKPTVKDFIVTPTTVSPGGSLTISAGVFAASARDPISEEVLVIEPTTSFARALNPPSRGKPGTGFPSGTWTRVITAPSAPGKYVYTLDATSEQCVNADRASVEVTVVP